MSYVGAIGLGCSLLAVRLRQRFPALALVGVILAWAQILGAAFDSLENVALLELLVGPPQAAWASVARVCAIPKFLIVLLGLLYLIAVSAYAFARADEAGGPRPDSDHVRGAGELNRFLESGTMQKK